MASQILQPSDLGIWNSMTEHHNEIDRKYDYRYSQLDLVFGNLLREKWIDEEDRGGLREDKLELSVLMLGSSLEETQGDLV